MARMAGTVLARMSQACDGLDSVMSDRLTACWRKANELMEPIMPDTVPVVINTIDPVSVLPDSFDITGNVRTM